MRLAILAPRPDVQGPLPKLTPLLVDGLRRLGCEVKLLAWGRQLEDEPMLAKVVGRGRDVFGARRAVIQGEFPVVIVNTAHDLRTLTRDLALLHALPCDRCIVLHFHGSQSPRLLERGSQVFKLATTMLLRRADGLLVLSHEEAAEWSAFSRHTPIHVVRNARPILEVGARVEGSGSSATPTVLCVARLIAGKGASELVRALPLVLREGPCRLVLAGDGPEAGRIRALADDLAVSESVEFHGYVGGTELATLYRSADVFALPTSLPEGFPTAILEAMAAGLPIVTTKSRGPADHLTEGEHALFVPPDDPVKLAAALTRVLADADLRSRMGKANRKKVREFDADPVAAEYLAALEDVVGRSRGTVGRAGEQATRGSSPARCHPLRQLRPVLADRALRIQTHSRTSKWELYRNAFPPRRGERVLDVGVSSFDDLPGENYFLRRYPFPDQLTGVGIDDLHELERRYPEVTLLEADGRSLPFPDQSFDVVHSNAVIEHVGSREDQERFIAELVRVGRSGFVTTPNRWFPIETHCKLPLLHWLPRRLVTRLATMLDEPDLRWWLLGAQGFRRLFPATVDARLSRTKVLGWPLTLVMVYRARERPSR